MKPGIYPNTPRAQYDALGAVNQSLIKRFAPNPWAWKQGLRKQEQSPAMVHGQLFEAYLLDDKDALQRFAVFNKEVQASLLAAAKERGHKGGFSKNLKEYQSWKVSEIDQGKTIVDSYDVFSAKVAAGRCKDDPHISDFLSAKGLETNIMLVWNDPETGLLCKGLVDCHVKADFCLCDVKTSAAIMGKDVEGAARKFYWQALDLGYDLQAGAYLDGWKHASKELSYRSINYPDKTGWRFILSGNEEPFPPASFSFDKETIERGRAKWHEGLKLWKQCQDSGEFPGLTTKLGWMQLTKSNMTK